MEELQVLIDAIKDYGAAIISTISVGGIAAVAGVIAKVKEGIDKTKNSMNEVLKKKDDEAEKMAVRYNTLVGTIEEQNKKIDKLMNKIDKLEE